MTSMKLTQKTIASPLPDAVKHICHYNKLISLKPPPVQHSLSNLDCAFIVIYVWRKSSQHIRGLESGLDSRAHHQSHTSNPNDYNTFEFISSRD
jgi:hypothetical protein